MSDIESLVRTMVTSIVDDTTCVSIEEAESNKGRLFEVKVGKDDVGKIIGKEGRIDLYGGCYRTNQTG